MTNPRFNIKEDIKLISKASIYMYYPWGTAIPSNILGTLLSYFLS